jgi:hypothetical protein
VSISDDDDKKKTHPTENNRMLMWKANINTVAMFHVNIVLTYFSHCFSQMSYDLVFSFPSLHRTTKLIQWWIWALVPDLASYCRTVSCLYWIYIVICRFPTRRRWGSSLKPPVRCSVFMATDLWATVCGKVKADEKSFLLSIIQVDGQSDCL